MRCNSFHSLDATNANSPLLGQLILPLFVGILPAFFHSGCGGGDGGGGGGGTAPDISAVQNWVYQLQNIDLAALGNTTFDLVVMDYSSDGSEGGEFSAAQITNLKYSAGGEKIVIAYPYMDIGEAEPGGLRASTNRNS